MQEDNCSSQKITCGPIDPVFEVERSTLDMIYDDADSDWGHRDNILNPNHRKVNIGVAYAATYFVLVQHFEGGDVVAIQPPKLSGAKLAFTLKNVTGRFGIHDVISVFYDPPPSSKTVDEINALRSYCVGGGFKTDCEDPVAVILSPPSPNSYYPNLEPEDVVADIWKAEADTLTIEANLGGRAAKAGCYTIGVFADEATRGDSKSVVLVALSACK